MSPAKAIIALILSLALGACELRNRGGTVDWLEDKLFFKADTKSLRVIRSYTLVAGLARLSGRSPYTIEERRVLSSKISTALALSRDAFNCVYDKRYGPDGCIFFDDVMAQLDVSVLRLARAIFLPEENKDLIAVLQKELLGSSLPSDLFGAAGKIAEAAGEVGLAGGSAANVVGALIRLGENALRTGSRLAPLYRDSLELQMRIVIDGLDLIAKSGGLGCAAGEERARSPSVVTATRVARAAPGPDICSDLAETRRLFDSGAGELALWRSHARVMFEKYGARLAPNRDHFVQVSALVARACASLMGGSSEANTCARLTPANSPRGLIFGKDARKLAWGAPEELSIDE